MKQFVLKIKWYIINLLLSNHQKLLIDYALRQEAYKLFNTMNETAKEDSNREGYHWE